MGKLIRILCALVGVAVVAAWPTWDYEGTGPSVIAWRSQNNPLITFNTSESLGNNINGPSVIRTPAWIENPLGTYYMYFAHHRGKNIRLAYADNLEGPWTLYGPGTLRLMQTKAVRHIASPDVHVDEEKKEVRMYFHGPIEKRTKKGMRRQVTFVAISKDGLSFVAGGNILGHPYFRVFKRLGFFYAIDGKGFLNRSRYAGKDWQVRDNMLVRPIVVDDEYGRRTDVRIRHSAVLLKEDLLYIFYTRKGDAPERILLATIRLTDDWTQWKVSEPVEVLRPREEYEGTQYPIESSARGKGIKVQQLRDPYIIEEDGGLYLFYSFGGEMGIAMAGLNLTGKIE